MNLPCGSNSHISVSSFRYAMQCKKNNFALSSLLLLCLQPKLSKMSSTLTHIYPAVPRSKSWNRFLHTVGWAYFCVRPAADTVSPSQTHWLRKKTRKTMPCMACVCTVDGLVSLTYGGRGLDYAETEEEGTEVASQVVEEEGKRVISRCDKLARHSFVGGQKAHMAAP